MKMCPPSVHALLLALLLARAHTWSFCRSVRSMMHQVDNLRAAARQLHHLTEEELTLFEGGEHRLRRLPNITHTAKELQQTPAVRSLSLLLSYSRSIRLHVLWLEASQHNVSVSSEAAERLNRQLLTLSHSLQITLSQVKVEPSAPPSLPPSAPPSLPPSAPPSVPPAASPPPLPPLSSLFEMLRCSVEISSRTQAFCSWSKHVLMLVLQKSECFRKTYIRPSLL